MDECASETENQAQSKSMTKKRTKSHIKLFSMGKREKGCSSSVIHFQLYDSTHLRPPIHAQTLLLLTFEHLSSSERSLRHAHTTNAQQPNHSDTHLYYYYLPNPEDNNLFFSFFNGAKEKTLISTFATHTQHALQTR